MAGLTARLSFWWSALVVRVVSAAAFLLSVIGNWDTLVSRAPLLSRWLPGGMNWGFERWTLLVLALCFAMYLETSYRAFELESRAHDTTRRRLKDLEESFDAFRRDAKAFSREALATSKSDRIVWSPYMEPMANELLFNLTCRQDVNVAGIRCIIEDPSGKQSVSEVGHARVVKEGETIWYSFPKHFQGASPLRKGRYRALWQSKDSTSERFNDLVEEAHFYDPRLQG